MMSNARRILRGIFGILLVFSMVSAAFAQQEQQPGSALSQSQFMQIIDRIDKSKEEMRNYIDKKFDELDTKIDKRFGELETKIDDLKTNFHELDKKVAVLRSDVDKLFAIIMTIAVAVGVHLLIFIGSHIYAYWRSKANVDENKEKLYGDFARPYFASMFDSGMFLHSEPKDDAAYNNRGTEKAYLGHYDAAISDFDKAIRLNPDNIEAYFNRGLSKKKLGNGTAAKQDFQKALSLAQEAGDAELIDHIKKQMK